MFKVLIVTYYFPPNNSIAAWRPYSWFKYFPESNIDTTVVTRHWQGNENSWEDFVRETDESTTIEKGLHSRIIRLPFRYTLLKKISSSVIFNIKILRKILYFFIKLFGKIAIEVDACTAFDKYITEYLKTNKIDAFIISCPPHNLAQLAYRLSKTHNIPVIIDFRDLWDNDELKRNYRPSLRKRTENIFDKFHLKRWLKQAEFITTVSGPMVEKINMLTDRKVIEITNGFENDLFLNSTSLPGTDFFTISIIGTIYPKQDISIIMNGLTTFIAKVGSKRVKLNFIGLESIIEISEKVKSAFPKECLIITPRLSRTEAIEYTLASHVLLYAGWKDYAGIYSGKIFDYLGSRRNILIAPGDDDVIDQLLLKSKAGKIANSAEAFSTILLQWHEEWKQHGKLTYNGIEDVITLHTREHQAKLFASHILSAFHHS